MNKTIVKFKDAKSTKDRTDPVVYDTKTYRSSLRKKIKNERPKNTASGGV